MLLFRSRILLRLLLDPKIELLEGLQLDKEEVANGPELFVKDVCEFVECFSSVVHVARRQKILGSRIEWLREALRGGARLLQLRNL